MSYRKSDGLTKKAAAKANRKLKREARLEEDKLRLKQFIGISILANVILLVVLALFAGGLIHNDKHQMEGFPATLPPENFQDEAREAYQVAADIPAVLDGSFCYCGCDETAGHGSLLDCYVDQHGVSCGTCQNEAFRAQELWDEGHTIYEISNIIDKEFGPAE